MQDLQKKESLYERFLIKTKDKHKNLIPLLNNSELFRICLGWILRKKPPPWP